MVEAAAVRIHHCAPGGGILGAHPGGSHDVSRSEKEFEFVFVEHLPAVGGNAHQIEHPAMELDDLLKRPAHISVVVVKDTVRNLRPHDAEFVLAVWIGIRSKAYSVLLDWKLLAGAVERELARGVFRKLLPQLGTGESETPHQVNDTSRMPVALGRGRRGAAARPRCRARGPPVVLEGGLERGVELAKSSVSKAFDL